MKIKRTVTIEIDCVKIKSDRNFGRLLWCEACRQQTEFLSPQEILEIAEILKFKRTIDKSRLHFFQASDAERLICLKSILSCSKF